MIADDDLDQTESYEPEEEDAEQFIELPEDNAHPVTTGSEPTQEHYMTMPSGMSSSFWSQGTPSQDGQRVQDASSRFDLFASQYFNTPNGNQLPPSGAPPPYSERKNHAPSSLGRAPGEGSAPDSLGDTIGATSVPVTTGNAGIKSNDTGSLAHLRNGAQTPASLSYVPPMGMRRVIDRRNGLSGGQEPVSSTDRQHETGYTRAPVGTDPPVNNIFQDVRDMSLETIEQMIHLARIIVLPRTQEEADKINDTVDELRTVAQSTVSRGTRHGVSPGKLEVRPGGLQSYAGVPSHRADTERPLQQGLGHSPQLAGGPQYRQQYHQDQYGTIPVIPGQATAHSTPVQTGDMSNRFRTDTALELEQQLHATTSQPRYETRSHTAAVRQAAASMAQLGLTDANYFTAPPPGGHTQATAMSGRTGDMTNSYQVVAPTVTPYPDQPQTVMTPAVAPCLTQHAGAIVPQEPSRTPFTRREGSTYVAAPITLDLNQTSAHVAALYQDRDLLPPPGGASGQGIRIGDFDNNKESWAIWSHKFKLMAFYNGWNDTQAKIQLATRLSGPIVEAQSALIRRSDTTLQDVLTKIDAWFCTPGDNMNKEGKFIHMTRNTGESLVRFGLRIDSEAARAFPGSEDAVVNSLKIHVLLQGCTESTRQEIFKIPKKVFKNVLETAQLQEEAAIYSGCYPAWDAHPTAAIRQATDQPKDTSEVAWTRDYNRSRSSPGNTWTPRERDRNSWSPRESDKSRKDNYRDSDGRRSETPSPDRKESRGAARGRERDSDYNREYDRKDSDRSRDTERRRDYDREYSGRSRDRRQSRDYRRDESRSDYQRDRGRSGRDSSRVTDKSVTRKGDRKPYKDNEDVSPRKKEGEYTRPRENDRRNDRSSSRGYRAREIQNTEDCGDSIPTTPQGQAQSN